MQKHTVKLLLKLNKKNKAGHHPVYLRITVNRKSSHISTGYFIPKKLWDEKAEQVRETHSQASEINRDINNRKKEALNNLVNADVKGTAISAAGIKQQTKGKDHTNFFEYAAHYFKIVKSKRSVLTMLNAEKHIRKLENFSGGRQLTFEEITPGLLNEFEAWLRETVKKRKEDSNNYIHAIMKTIRRIFNVARKSDITTAYPFSRYEMPEVTPGDKDYLSLSELDTWEQYQPPEHLRQAHIYFLFGCYTGLRISDWQAFNVKQIQQGEIRLRARKNGEWVSIPIHARLERVIKKLVPLTNHEPKLNLKFKLIAKACGIDKHLSSHCGRKTFAVTMCLDRGISSETAAELMGITLKVFVENYSKVTTSKIKKETSAAWIGL